MAEKFQNHGNKRKGKEKKKERGNRGKDEKKKKAVVALLVFIIATLEIFAAKNCSTLKVHLAITLLKIRLELQRNVPVWGLGVLSLFASFAPTSRPRSDDRYFFYVHTPQETTHSAIHRTLKKHL